ncbi:unnamed protein product [Gadus morhua 'NCC']
MREPHTPHSLSPSLPSPPPQLTPSLFEPRSLPASRADGWMVEGWDRTQRDPPEPGAAWTARENTGSRRRLADVSSLLLTVLASTLTHLKHLSHSLAVLCLFLFSFSHRRKEKEGSQAGGRTGANWNTRRKKEQVTPSSVLFILL